MDREQCWTSKRATGFVRFVAGIFWLMAAAIPLWLLGYLAGLSFVLLRAGWRAGLWVSHRVNDCSHGRVPKDFRGA